MFTQAGVGCFIRIQTPRWFDPHRGDFWEANTLDVDPFEPSGVGRLLESVTLSKSINWPCGRFSLRFAPEKFERGYLLSDLIPGYSLVEIWLQRYPDEPRLVMIGLTDCDTENVNFGRDPQRTIQLAGRELTSIFVDQRTLYLPQPPLEQRARDPLSPEMAEVEGLAQLYRPQAALFGMLAIDPELAKIGGSPVDAIESFVRMVTTGIKTPYNPTGIPLLNLELPHAPLDQLIHFDAARARQSLFDPTARLPSSSQNIQTGIPLWSLMSTWSDPAYQELFARTRQPPPGLRNGFGAVEIVFRKKPFAGRLDERGRILGVAPATGTQFDPGFAETDTDEVGIEDLVACSGMTRSTERVQNLYVVYPQVPGLNHKAFDTRHQPTADADPNSPASLRRFGMRLRRTADYYFSDAFTADDSQRANARERLLWCWHRFEPLFRRGVLQLTGRPDLDIGRRLVLQGLRPWAHEFYTTGITHSLNFSDEPTFNTQVTVERGWPV